MLQSISRLAIKISDDRLKTSAAYLKRILAVYLGAEDLINVGAYATGSNAEIDEAIEKIPDVNRFLVQGIEEKSTMEDAIKGAAIITGELAGQSVKQNETIQLQTG